MREPQGLPGVHCVFRASERGAPKEPRLPAGARALFFAIRGPCGGLGAVLTSDCPQSPCVAIPGFGRNFAAATPSLCPTPPV